jgi:hypothetical protein
VLTASGQARRRASNRDGPKRCVGAQEDWKRIRDRWERRDPLDIAGYVEAGSLVETTS